MDSLPPERRPMVGTDGAKYRRQQMVYQLPIHDHDENYCDNLTDLEREKMREFCKMRNDKALGVGDIREKTVGTPKWVSFEFLLSLYIFPKVFANDEIKNEYFGLKGNSLYQLGQYSNQYNPQISVGRVLLG